MRLAAPCPPPILVHGAQKGNRRSTVARQLATLASAIVLLAGLLVGSPRPAYAAPAHAQWEPEVPRWGVQEVVLASRRAYANPFKDVQVQATFRSGRRSLTVDGFHDGSGTWRVRFMPDIQGSWSFETESQDPELDTVRGNFRVSAAAVGDHGPVRVVKTHHFSYADGTPYFLLGTTSYNWINRDDTLQEQTLAALRETKFNKLRFGIFPKWFDFNRVSPTSYPFVRSAPEPFDLDRFDVAFFQHLERRVRQLKDMGIEADIILFHPYDNFEKWGFSKMSRERDRAYLRYVVARLSAFSNVWWTMANEFELMPPNSLEKMFNRPVPAGVESAEPKNWDELAQLVQGADAYHHPIGMHNWAKWYDHAKPWISHAIVQDGGDNASRSARVARERYRKPVVVDEYGYEGNNSRGWGALTGPQAVSRHWEITMAGAYASHGETYVHPGVVFWGAGGPLVGDSPPRLAFLKQVMTSLPFQDMRPARELVVNGSALAKPGEAYLFRFPWPFQGFAVPWGQVRLSGAERFKVELIDPWLMKIYELGYTYPGDQRMALPMTPSLLRVTAAPSQVGTGELTSIHAMLGKFAGEETPEEKADPALFKDDPLFYSLDYSVEHILQNAEAKAVLVRYFPEETLTGLSTVFPVEMLAKTRNLDSARLQQLGRELNAVRVR